MHIKSSHHKALQAQLASLPTALSSLIFTLCGVLPGGDPSEPRRGIAQKLQHQAFSFSQADVELSPGGHSWLLVCTPASLLFNSELKHILEDQRAGESLRCCKTIRDLALLTLAGPSSKACQCCSCWRSQMSEHQCRTWRIRIMEIHATGTLQRLISAFVMSL